jgi:hypothetical protein
MLLIDRELAGRYVALKSEADRTVVASSSSPEDALAQAKRAGCETPVLIYVPEKDSVHIY